MIVGLGHVGGKLAGQSADLVADIDDRLDWIARGYLDLLLFRFFIRVQVLRLGELANDVVLKVVLPHCEGLARARILKLFRLPTCAHHSVKVEVDQHRVSCDQLVPRAGIDEHEAIELLDLVVEEDIFVLSLLALRTIPKEAEHARRFEFFISVFVRFS